MAETVTLKGGHVTTDKRLDRIPQFDEESRDYPVTRRLTARRDGTPSRPRSYTWKVGLWLDQGQEGACTGFARAHDCAARPVPMTGVDNAFAQRVYQRAKQLDEWPGENYEGSSVLGAVKAAQEFRYVEEYHWAFTLEDVILGIGYTGPAVIGVNWYRDMFNPDSSGFLRPTGGLAGGHSTLLNGIRCVYHGDGPFDLDLDASYVRLWNSWGSDWGFNGTAKVTLRDFDKLRKEDGEVCFSHDIKQ